MASRVKVDGEAMTRYMKLLGVSGRDLAKASGLNKSTVEKMLRGEEVFPSSYGTVLDAIKAGCSEKGIQPPIDLIKQLDRPPGNDKMVQGMEKKRNVVFVIPGDSSNYSPSLMAEILKTISDVIGREIDIEIRFGSVKIFVSLSEEEEEAIRLAIKAGKFSRFESLTCEREDRPLVDTPEKFLAILESRVKRKVLQIYRHYTYIQYLQKGGKRRGRRTYDLETNPADEDEDEL